MNCVRNCSILFIWTWLAAVAGQPETIQYTRPGQVLKFGPADSETVLLAAFGGGLMTLNNGEINVPQRGDHWLALAARDKVGNVSAVRWVRILIDPDPPVIELTLSPQPVAANGRLWLPPDARAELIAEDKRSGLADAYLGVNGAEQRGTEKSLAVALPSDGDIELLAYARDRVGNVSEQKKSRASIDNKPPEGALSIIGPHLMREGRLVVSPGIEIKAEIQDRESGLARWEPWLDGSAVDPERWRGNWEEREYEVTARSFDRVGNQTLIGPLVFTVDKSPPRIQWTVTGRKPSKCEGWYQPPVILSVSAEDEKAGIASLSWSENGTEWTPVAGPIVLTGEHITLKAVDQVGNTAKNDATWRFDHRAPTIELTDDRGNGIPSDKTVVLVLDQRLGLALADEGCGVDIARYSFDNGITWSPAPEAFVFEKPGLFQLIVEAADQLGNSSVRSWSLRVQKNIRGGRLE